MDQPPPSKTSKPTSQTTCWRIGFCGRRSDAAHTNKSPAKGTGLGGSIFVSCHTGLARSLRNAASPSPQRPAALLVARCAEDPQEKAPPKRGKFHRRGLPLATTASPSRQYHSWLRSARRRKSPAEAGLKSAMWIAGGECKESNPHRDTTTETVAQRRVSLRLVGREEQMFG